MASIPDQLTEKLISIRRHLHENPELSYEEFETTKAIKNWLDEANITIIDSNLETGVIAEISGNKNGPVVALRADIDALPIQEETDLPYTSKIQGKMHACGHDFHTAAVLGAAYLLKKKKLLLMELSALYSSQLKKVVMVLAKLLKLGIYVACKLFSVCIINLIYQ